MFLSRLLIYIPKILIKFNSSGQIYRYCKIIDLRSKFNRISYDQVQLWLFQVIKVLLLRSFKYPYKIINKVKTKSISNK